MMRETTSAWTRATAASAISRARVCSSTTVTASPIAPADRQERDGHEGHHRQHDQRDDQGHSTLPTRVAARLPAVRVAGRDDAMRRNRE